MSPYISTQSGYNDNINISTEDTTIPTSPSTYVTKSVLDTKIQAMFDQFDKQHEKLDKMMQNLTNNVKNWLLSDQRHYAYTRTLRCSSKQPPSFHKN